MTVEIEKEIGHLSVGKPRFELSVLTDFLTALISFPCVTWYAGTGHCSERKCVVNCALCIAGTRRYGLAGIFAFFLQAGLPAWAVSVGGTFHFRNWN